MDLKERVRQYFKAIEERNSEEIMALFDENCEVFFSDFGVLKGKEAFRKLNKKMFHTIQELNYKTENFLFTIEDYRVVVEGVEFGKLRDGERIKDNRFSGVFDFDQHSILIQRMYIYTDPSFGINKEIGK